MVERERLEPAGGMMRNSNLLTPLEFVSPLPPSNAQIWHQIRHWLQLLQTETYVSRDIARACLCQPTSQRANSGPH